MRSLLAILKEMDERSLRICFDGTEPRAQYSIPKACESALMDSAFLKLFVTGGEVGWRAGLVWAPGLYVDCRTTASLGLESLGHLQRASEYVHPALSLS